MGIPFMCGAVPSSFTVPVILPSPAALTFWLKIDAARIITPQAIKTSKAMTCAFLFITSPWKNANNAGCLGCYAFAVFIAGQQAHWDLQASAQATWPYPFLCCAGP